MVNVIKFLATRGLAFRSSEEKIVSQTNGDFLGIIELTSQYDAFLAENLVKYGTLGSGNTSYLFKTIYKEFIIHFMVKEVFSFTVKEMKDRKYFSLSVDSTPYLTLKRQPNKIVKHTQTIRRQQQLFECV